MKRLKLKKIWKERLEYLLIFLMLGTFLAGTIIIANDRFERIENGELVVIDQNGGDR